MKKTKHSYSRNLS